MTATGGPSPAAPAQRAVTTTDLLKAAGLLLILFDHWAYYVQPDADWMHAIGRGALPIFFFLIGFAKSRHVPAFWWIAGALLTALDWWHAGGKAGDITLNILISFAMIRWLLPLAERHVLGSRWRIAALVLALLALSQLADLVLDYGTAGWLLALVGLAHRLALEAGPDRPRDPAWLLRRLLGAVATLLFVANEIDDYAFGTVDAFIAAGFIIAASGVLLRFRRMELGWQPPAPLAWLLRVSGRWSLEIYIAQIIGLMALGVALGIEPDDGLDEEQ